MGSPMTKEELRAEDLLKERVRGWKPSTDPGLHIIGCVRWTGYKDCSCGRWGFERNRDLLKGFGLP